MEANVTQKQATVILDAFLDLAKLNLDSCAICNRENLLDVYTWQVSGKVNLALCITCYEGLAHLRNASINCCPDCGDVVQCYIERG